MLQQQIINSQKKRKKRGKKEQRNYKTPEMNKMAIVSQCISIINLHINRLNSPIKKHRVAKQRK